MSEELKSTISELKTSGISIATAPDQNNQGVQGIIPQMPVAKKEKVLILFYQEYPNQTPTHDEVVDHVEEALLSRNYQVSLLPINQSIDRITNGVKEVKPDLIFNLVETFRNNDQFDSNVTALIEMLKVPFTGATSGGLFLSNDKHVSKKIFDFHRISYADFFIVRVGQDVAVPRGFTYPLFVKPVREDASIGIDDNSVARDYESLVKKVKELHETLGGDVMVEEFIDGREFYVSVLGDDGSAHPLSIVELDFSKWPEGKPKIYSNKAKNDEHSEEFDKIDFNYGPDLEKTLPKDVQKKIGDLAIKVCKALDVRDYARIDMRMDQSGKLYVLEANLNPYLAKGDIISMAGECFGLSYEDLVEAIVKSALARAKAKV
ncbi:MAG TPA: ATP-grasp domain-containing protein [Candidatus Paceibacterota bacterium]|nr:ATP-grasp domain-containing protein [Candidatus Paceibacterota bacterium]